MKHTVVSLIILSSLSISSLNGYHHHRSGGRDAAIGIGSFAAGAVTGAALSRHSDSDPVAKAEAEAIREETRAERAERRAEERERKKTEKLGNEDLRKQNEELRAELEELRAQVQALQKQQPSGSSWW